MVNQGIGQYQDLFNPMNINQSGYTFEDISGIALARENEDFYRMFSLWEDCILNTEDITFAQPEAAAASNPVVQADSEEVSVKEQVNRTTGQEAERKSAEMSGNVRESETVRRNAEDVSENEVEEAAVTSKPATPESAQSAGRQADLQQETAQMKAQQVRAMEAVQELLFRNTNPQGTMPQNTKLQHTTPQNAKPQEEMPAFEKVFINRDFIDAFEDDYFYDCVEVTPELLKQLPIEDDAVVNNSFLVHGYYNFKHILLEKYVKMTTTPGILSEFRECTVTGSGLWHRCLAFATSKRATEATIPIHISDTGIRKYRQSAGGLPICHVDIHKSKQCLLE